MRVTVDQAAIDALATAGEKVTAAVSGLLEILDSVQQRSALRQLAETDALDGLEALGRALVQIWGSRG